MNRDILRSLQLRLPTLRGWLILIGVVWLVGAIGIGRVLGSLLLLIVLFTLLPIVGFLGLQWWVSRNLIQDQCPVCGAEFPGLNHSELNCPNCGEPLKIERSGFVRLTPPGTIEVDAIEVASHVIDD